MDGERKVNISEGVPLNSSGAANIFLNTGKKPKVNSRDGTVIHLKTEKPADVGVHINTTLSIASSKKIKLLFVLNFLLSLLCMVLSSVVAFYYWNEMAAMRRQLDVVREHFVIQTYKEGLNLDKVQQSALTGALRPPWQERREPRMERPTSDLTPGARTYFVDDLGEDMLLVDSSKKKPSQEKLALEIPAIKHEPVVVHFTGGIREINIGTNAIVGPWVRDLEVSTKNSEVHIELNSNYVTIKETGLYMVYAQVVYLTRSPNCFFIWARQPGLEPRLVSTCATGDDNSARPLDKSQMSCGVQTVARLLKGDTVNIAQRELNRTLWLRPGYSYFGFVKLSS